MTNHSDYLIVGAGVIGMMLARELCRSGASVTLLERQGVGQESSWAGGGIVSPLYPWRYVEPVTKLATWSQTSYVHLAQALLDETEKDPELRQRGMFMVSVEDAADALMWAERYNRPMQSVDSDFIYELEPNLRPGFSGALWMPEVSSIRNPRLVQSLRASLEKMPNCALIENTPVTDFVRQRERIIGCATPNGEYHAGETIITSGAWSAGLLASLHLELPVEPVHGQMMVFHAEPGLINRVVLLDGRYLIPRSDGRILVGSTLKRVGFNKETDVETRESLLATAVRMLPELENVPIEHHWAGLRPGSPQGVPFIGAVPGYEGLHVNAGHFRNGLVLAPASTRMHADILLGRKTIVDPTPYSLVGRVK